MIGVFFLFLHRYFVLMYYEAKNTFNNVWEGWFMKLYRAVALLITIATTDSLMSMEQQGAGQLNFLVDHDLSIIGLSQHNMKWSENLVGKTVNNLFPAQSCYSKKDPFDFLHAMAFKNGFIDPVSVIRIAYAYDDKQFETKIIGVNMLKGSGPSAYFVQVQEVQEQDFVKAQELHHMEEEELKAKYLDLIRIDWSEDCFNFLVDHNQCIRGYSNRCISVALKPNEFIGMNIIDVLPLEEVDRIAIIKGFAAAAGTKKTVDVFYWSDNKDFIAKLTALKMHNAEEGYNYFVEVKEAQ